MAAGMQSIQPQHDDEEFVALEPPAPRRPAIAAELVLAQQQIKELESELAEVALALAEGKPVSEAELRALYDRRQTALFSLEVKALADGLAEEVDRQAVQLWKDDVLQLAPREIADGIAVRECPDFCKSGCGCALTGFRQCHHPATFTTFPNDLIVKGVSSEPWRAAAAVLREQAEDEGDDE
ncbi:MAG TPA: hypothetical protein VIQ05_23210 [Tardiphaga sp.]